MADAPVPENEEGQEQDRETAMREQEQEWDEAMQQASQIAKTAGRGSHKVDAMIEASNRSQIDWRTILRRFMYATAKTDYSWLRPNHRHIDDGLYLPSLYAEAMPPIVFCIDTSYSLNEADLAAMWAEIRSVAEELNPESLVVVQCADQVGAVDSYHPSDMPEQIKIKVRGGTAFSPAFKAVDDLPTKPACLIYLTDLYCYDYPKVEPDYPTIWCATPDASSEPPPFGEVVQASYRED